MDQQDWLYFLVYPGSPEGVDFLISEVVRPAVDCARATGGIDRWFFLRNIDDNGIHLRLRFRGTLTAIGQLQGSAEHLISAALERERKRPHVPLTRLIPFRYAPAVHSKYIGYRLGIYEPEYDKFGGEAGLDIAERCFQSTSTLVMEALCHEPLEMASRAVLALLLMAAGVAEAISPSERTGFWEHYAWYWSGGEHASAAKFRTNLTTAARKRGSWVGERCREYATLPGVRERMEAYRQAIRAALCGAKEAGVDPNASALCFQYVHLTNNRLGILPVEEAYLANLVQTVTWSAELSSLG